MDKIKDGDIIVILGKRNTGKSFLTRDIMYHKRNIPVGSVISMTEKANRFFCKFIPSGLIYEKYNQTILENFWKRQEKLAEKVEQGENVDQRAYLIFDDCIGSVKDWRYNELIQNVFFIGRHYKIFFILTMQYPLGILPDMRENIDFVFILRTNKLSLRKKIYEHYTGMFPSFDFFCDVMDQCTEDYNCLVIDNKTQSNKLEDQVFWYKADFHDNFRVGPDEVWNKCNIKKSDNDNIDIADFRKQKSQKINVEKRD